MSDDDYTEGTLGCGRTIDELNDYLSNGRKPLNRDIEACPECQAALAALTRLHELTPSLLERDMELHTDDDETWLAELFTNISIQARAGRTITISSDDPDLSLTQTEGTVLSLIRSAGDEVNGALVGRCRLHGDLTEPGTEITVDVQISVFWKDEHLPSLAAAIRTEIRDILNRHTELNITDIDISVVDLEVSTGGKP
ncbi:putative alkaline shock family protein YloU [Arthrobacter sp. CAN_A212]|uniref:hypothetical protein n=1 Tax=Arthrobacter sp. CAN_A212 TaxID=2787719 RepID=UPI0018C99038